VIFGDLNLVFILFFIFFLTVVLNVNTALHLLLTAELLWISLYIIVLLVGFIFDNVNLLSLTFFFLILSAVEFGLGLVIILVQHLLLRSIYLNTMGKNMHKFALRFKKKIPQKSLLL
jgi:NADH:ubiquinone oxidoreductase subunit K